jgi:FMN phosphatase YigB (HAD superfamily)
LKIFYNHKKHWIAAAALVIAASSLILLQIIPVVWPSKKNSIIVESNSIADIFSFIKPDEYNHTTCVIFDIDNTLAKPHGQLGSDQWFHWSVKHYEKKGMDRKKAIDEIIMPRLLQFMNHSWLEPVEPNTAAVVKKLQEKGVTVIALTARSLDLTYRTIEQLNHIGITFAGTGLGNCPITYGRGKPALYIDGIIFSGHHKKGEVAAHWFNQIGYRPKKVIFIDDGMKNILSVENAFTGHNYPFVGIRYGHQDEYVKTLTPKIIAQEYKEFMDTFPESRPVATMPAY